MAWVNTRPPGPVTEAVLSAAAWLSLVGGVALLSAVAVLPRAVEYADAAETLRHQRQRSDAAAAEVQRLETLVQAIRSNSLFRDEWVRREWRLPPAAAGDTIRLDERLTLQPEAALPAKPVSGGRPAWAAAAVAIDSSTAAGRVLAAGGWLGVAFGLLAGGRGTRRSLAADLWSSLAGRYRLDRPHSLPPPHLDPVPAVKIPVAETPIEGTPIDGTPINGTPINGTPNEDPAAATTQPSTAADPPRRSD